MKEKVKKVLVWIFEFVLFCGYFYVLFVNLVCGFGYGGISSRTGNKDFVCFVLSCSGIARIDLVSASQAYETGEFIA